MSLKADLVKNDTIDETAPKSEGSLNEPTYDFKEVAKTITEIIQLLDDCEAKYSGTKSLTGVIKDQAKVIGARLLEITQTPSRKRQERFREDSVKLEEALGITDTYSRTNEALLFIDPPFLKTLSLAGVPHPEEGFGIAAWQNWLKARAEARNTENLDLATVMHLHEVVAAGLGETVAGKIRQEGALGGDYTETGTALHLKSQQLQALAGNPLLKINTLGEESAGVLIIYPNAKYQESYSACLKTLPEDVQQAEKAVLTTESLIKALLKETLSWYENEEAKLKADLDPSQREKDLQVIKIAAELQQRIVSIHPFRDGNGRLSRLLMNYVLEKHGVAPSIIELGDQDIFYTPEEWAKLVEEGTNKHERRIDESGTKMIDHLFTKNEIQYFELFYKQAGHNLMPNTSRLNHEQCREYLAEFSKSAADFKEWSSGTAKVGVEQVSFGGLAKIKDIAAGYDTSPNGWQQSNELYYSNIKVYRGGICKDVTDPHQFLEMFARPTAFNTAYRPLMEDGLTARSLEKPQLATIEQAAQDFNAALILDYAIAGAHPDLDTFEFGSRRNNRNPVIISTELANEFLKSKTVAGTLQREQEVWLKTKGDVSSAAAEVEEKLVFNAGIKGSYIARLLETHSRGNPAHVWASPMVSTSQNKESALKFTIDGIKPNIDGRNHGEYGVLVTASLPKSGFIICNDIRKVPAFQGDSYSWDLNNDGGEEEVLLNGGLAPNAIQEITALEPDGKIACIIRRMSNNEIVYTENSTGKSEIYVIDETGKLRLKP